MKKLLQLFFMCLVTAGTIWAAPVPPQQERLVQPSDITYVGAFLLPKSQNLIGDSVGRAITYDPSRKGLFITTVHDFVNGMSVDIEQGVMEVSIPAPINTTDQMLLPRATILQQPVRLFTTIPLVPPDPDGTNLAKQLIISGLYVQGQNLIANWKVPYDTAGYTYTTSVSSLNFANLATKGLFALQGGRHAEGPMGSIPTEWQPLLGTHWYTGGGCCDSILGTESAGPTFFTVDWTKVPAISGGMIPTQDLQDYPLAHATLGVDQETVNFDEGVYFNATMIFGGWVNPSGTRSNLALRTIGIGPFCYGEGYASGQPIPLDHPCLDNAYPNIKGQHAPPYINDILAFDENDLLAVKNGPKLFWAIEPYMEFSFPIPAAFQTPRNKIGGVCYWDGTRTIYVVWPGSPGGGGPIYPMILVYHIR